MDEILNKLLESEVLNDETKKQLTEAFQTKLTEAVDEAKKTAADAVRAELTEQYVTDFESLVEAIDNKTEDYLNNELAELKEDIANFRDLEAEYAERIVEERQKMAETVKGDMSQLIDYIDSFLGEALEEEFTELREDIQEVKKLEFGRQIFESVATEYQRNFVKEDETFNKLQETQETLEQTQKALKEAKTELQSTQRAKKLGDVLEPLAGKAKEVMETLLVKVPTDKLEEAYGRFISHVLHETVEVTEKENSNKESVLAEGKNVPTETVKKVVIVNGNQTLTENVESQTSEYEAELKRMRKLAGVKSI